MCQPVLLHSGLYCGSADFVVGTPEQGLAFLVANAGYDVWLGNGRGSTYARAHTTLKTSDNAFWDFSWHEMGLEDLPALVDYIYKVKGDFFASGKMTSFVFSNLIFFLFFNFKRTRA